MKLLWLAGILGIGISWMAMGQEMGRGSLNSEAAAPNSGTGRGTLVSSSQGSDFLGGTWGLKLGVGWAKAKWSVGQIDGSEIAFVPSGSIFYKPTDNLDINLSAMYVNAEDKVDYVDDVKTKADMTRIACGIRYWPLNNFRILPYVGCGIGYYLLDGKIDVNGSSGSVKLDVDNAPGAYFESGVAWKLADNICINTELSYDFLLSSPSVSLAEDEVEEDFKINTLGVTLGLIVML